MRRKRAWRGWRARWASWLGVSSVWCCWNSPPARGGCRRLLSVLMSRATPSRRPLSGEGPVILHAPTDPRWLPLALDRFDEVLVDHAHCEKKAAANALSLLQAYPELPGLPAQMARLAREESAHLARVLELMAAR